MSHVALPPPVVDAPALVAGRRGAVLLSVDGELFTPSFAEAAGILRARPVLVCHRRATAARLRAGPVRALDLLELFAFVRPARFCLPTPRGLAQALGLPGPHTPEAEAATLIAAVRRLLAELAAGSDKAKVEALGPAWAMGRGGWPWGPAVLAALGAGDAPHSRTIADGLKVWRRLPEWEERAAATAPGSWPVEPVEARARLVKLLGPGAEERPQQADYASAVSAAFMPCDAAGEPRLVLAEAGTGVGKTLGYIAPASVWAEKNEGTVWVSTYTRNLQRQLDGELDRLFPDPAEKRRRVVVRKGRENYVCLLNLEEAVQRLNPRGDADAVPLGLMARWVGASRDGDMQGGDFPGWLADLSGRRLTVELTDTRGECVYSACPHYRQCFIEHVARRARRARMVVANHALVMVTAALGGDEGGPLLRLVFDEGHHLFAAADSAFSADLTGAEAAELRRWILGAEEGRATRSRGLRARIEDLVAGNGPAIEAVQEVLRAARDLPAPAWHQRIAGGNPVGPAEAFLARVRQQVYARDANTGSPYSLETATLPPVPGLLEAAEALEAALTRLVRPATALLKGLAQLLDDEADELDAATRTRIEAVRRSLDRRVVQQTAAWRSMLAGLAEGVPPDFVDWFGVERLGGRDVDVGLHRHWVDPTRPFAETVLALAHGALVTSATLRDSSGDAAADWAVAEERTGVRHLMAPLVKTAVASPFDYPAMTRVLVVTDVRRDDKRQVAAAFRALFLAAGGGALGLFTAIARLRQVHEAIAPALEAAGLPLFAQHVDALDTGTLIDIFRAEEDACLLGTDAVRDGIDVPGRSLRLIVFDRVPWPRPDLLHKARRAAFGGRAYEEMLTRLKLEQAFGRLVRRAGDRGVFVMLDAAFPSRLATAFPDGVAVRRIGLAEAVAETADVLGRKEE